MDYVYYIEKKIIPLVGDSKFSQSEVKSPKRNMVSRKKPVEIPERNIVSHKKPLEKKPVEKKQKFRKLSMEEWIWERYFNPRYKDYCEEYKEFLEPTLPY